MAVITDPGWRGSGSHDAQGLRALATVLGAAPVQTFTGGVSPTDHGGAHGVQRGLTVSEKSGTPDMSVDVAAGTGLVTGTSSLAQGVYPFLNDATVNLAITAADGTYDRHDLVVAHIQDDAEDGGGSDDARLFVVDGTPAASPADPALPDGALVLARVVVQNGATSITDSDIADLRTWCAAAGGVLRCTSTTRPDSTGRYPGQIIYETDTDEPWMFIGGVWVLLLTSPAMAAYTTTDPIGGTTPAVWDAFETVETDPRSWKTSASRITPDLAGLFRVTSTAAYTGSETDTIRLRLLKNGTAVQTSTGPTLNVLVTVNGPTDYLEIDQENGLAFTTSAVGNAVVEYLGPS